MQTLIYALTRIHIKRFSTVTDINNAFGVRLGLQQLWDFIVPTQTQPILLYITMKQINKLYHELHLH